MYGFRFRELVLPIVVEFAATGHSAGDPEPGRFTIQIPQVKTATAMLYESLDFRSTASSSLSTSSWQTSPIFSAQILMENDEGTELRWHGNKNRVQLGWTGERFLKRNVPLL